MFDHFVMVEGELSLLTGLLLFSTGLQRTAMAAIGQEIAHLQRGGRVQLPEWMGHIGWRDGKLHNVHCAYVCDDCVAVLYTHAFSIRLWYVTILTYGKLAQSPGEKRLD